MMFPIRPNDVRRFVVSSQKESLQGGLSQEITSHNSWSARLHQVTRGALAQFRELWKLLLLLYVPMVLLFLVLRIVSHSSDEITFSYLTRDVAAIAGLPFYAGFLSQMGALLWAGSLTICIFSLLALGRQSVPATRRWLLQASILTAILLFDDVFQFHEEIADEYLGLSETLVVVSYGVVGLILLVINLGEILSSEYLILGLALILFALSAFVDGADLGDFGAFGRLFTDQLETFVEDGLKFAGVATWLVYFARYGVQKIRSVSQS
jgi:hypothetical protein